MKNKNYELPATSYIPVIGLEVHVELKTKSKMFCGCSADYFGEKPNSNTCPVCLGLPGALPVPNKKAIEWCVTIGLALNCKIPLFSKFDRKNYFYPDLPKGYQISQYDKPFCINGWIEISPSNVILGRNTATTPESPSPKVLRDSGQARMTKGKLIRIRRVHMEEDTGKLMHTAVNREKVSLIDFNRSGVPLVEIVTEPDFEEAHEVVEYLKKLQQIVRYLNVSDADMEKGEMRMEPNISLKSVILASGGMYQTVRPGARPESPSKVREARQASMTDTLPPYKVEVKNINSFRFVEKAINYEIERQGVVLDSGNTPIQETRGWDEDKQKTISQRAKEEAQDYRYFPEPDIPPVRLSGPDIASIECTMPELPDIKMQRFTNIYGLSVYDADILTRDREIAEYFDEAADIGFHHEVKRKQIANYIINKKVDISKTLPAELIQIIINDAQKPSLDENKLHAIIEKVLAKNSKAVNDYKSGKENVIMFLVGLIMRTSGMKLDAKVLIEKLKKMLQ